MTDIGIFVNIRDELGTAEIGAVDGIVVGRGGVADNIGGLYPLVEEGDIGRHSPSKRESHAPQSISIHIVPRQQEIYGPHAVEDISAEESPAQDQVLDEVDITFVPRSIRLVLVAHSLTETPEIWGYGNVASLGHLLSVVVIVKLYSLFSLFDVKVDPGDRVLAVGAMAVAAEDGGTLGGAVFWQEKIQGHKTVLLGLDQVLLPYKGATVFRSEKVGHEVGRFGKLT